MANTPDAVKLARYDDLVEEVERLRAASEESADTICNAHDAMYAARALMWAACDLVAPFMVLVNGSAKDDAATIMRSAPAALAAVSEYLTPARNTASPKPRASKKARS